MTGFVIGGVVPVRSDAYIERSFEQDVFSFLTAGDWVTLLGPRQHGKTSALVRLRKRLTEEGIIAALIDLHAFPAVGEIELPSFLSWFSAHIRQQLELEPIDFDQPADVATALEIALRGAASSAVIMLDEAARLPPDVAQAFFSQLRAVHTAQRSGQTTGGLSTVVFLFAGTFRPDTIIDDDNSPFNVSRIVDSNDLTLEQVRELGERVAGPDQDEWAGRIYDEVGGQPYLVQSLFDALVAGENPDGELIFNAAIGRIASGADAHLPGIYRRVSREPGADALLARLVAAGADGIATSGDGLASFLVTVGIARVLPDLRLVPRNALYARALAASPSFNPDAFLTGESLHPDETPSLVTPLGDADLAWVVDEELRAIVRNVHDGAVASANAQHHRVALAGFGAAYEGLLLAFVEQLDESVRDSLRMGITLSRGQQPPKNVDKCTFEALVEIAHATGELSNLPKGGSTIARDWRNLIHPAKARKQFESELDLRPEVQIMAALITKVIQVRR